MQRVRPNWLNENDELILELLGKSGVALNKRGIELNLELNGETASYSTIKRRVDKLSEAEFIEKVRQEGSYYQITSKGINYLTGSPYGAATAGNEPVEATEIDPLDYQILEEVQGKDDAPSVDEVVALVSAEPERIRDRIRALVSEGMLAEDAEGHLKLSLGGQYLLQMFRLEPDTTEDVGRYGYVELTSGKEEVETE
ncbi:winged-helix domain-containing protein [Halobacterium bonnevillei]|uniref:Ribonuclease R winged-helix domain-containing protein n=1 Tax=Halobacterium bonnevillei TaxID=2692200 RepID=A0A6B0SIA5_9EURY|nr:winged-helix domain-containing protein [Halobacterium bonnevillei]MXR21418.1 hypothetical protein [Halobacterium bonnevillei]